MTNLDARIRISDALKSFSKLNLRHASIELLKTLGYESEKTLDLDGAPDSFLNEFARSADLTFKKDKALFEDWEEIHLLFQLTDEELSGQFSLFEQNVVKPGLMQSYLFFAVKLKGTLYARGKLAQITRQLNRLFPMPVMVFFEFDEKLSIAVINRRQHKREADKDVLGKVTLIQGISLTTPHRGHLDVLDSFSLRSLGGKHGINNFDALHNAWEEIFNVELLNKKFYRELSNWYFWAMEHVRFPFDSEELDKHAMDKNDLLNDKEKIREHDAKNLIRLLTRLLFVWFMKEKGLVPEQLFETKSVNRLFLDEFEENSNETIFYKAILQNLFFATLNQTRGKRAFRNRDGQHRNITNLMRYEKYFRAPEEFVTLVDSIVPFMNGGLFDCLDKPHSNLKGPQGGDVILYEDGFSDRTDNVLRVPDFLFFGDERAIDLSDIFSDKKRKNEKVRGIIHVLNSYKFTIVENTPIEQEIALDPELLGQVFENLLASYNPETKTTARKQTGSFYTPRTIVDYMVNESLKAYLGKALCAACRGVSEEDARTGLDILFAYTEREHAFSENETKALIKAIDECKILDPACGSGAFPMGILHKLVFILGKLDPHNEQWKQRQLEKLDSVSMREDLEQTFEDNDDDYGRKLYLIENCIYGVDIQSIATQVSKLRFFISLIVDQEIHPDKENFGIRPLPNLESKFTTADTLIRIEKPEGQSYFESETVSMLETELKQVRHSLFSAKTPKTKRKYQKRDKELREAISQELEQSGWSERAAQQLANWDPYDQNASAPFFDPSWMYGINDGFDVLIGNPPYVQIQKFPKKQKEKWVEQKYKTYGATADIYCLFYERGAQLLREGGHLCFITSNKWMRANYGDKLRGFLSTTVDTKSVLDFGMAQNFGAATTYTNILSLENSPSKGITRSCYVADDRAAMSDPETYFGVHSVPMSGLNDAPWIIITPERFRIKNSVESQGVALEKWDLRIYRGVLTGLNEAFYLSQEARDALVAKEPQSERLLVPLLRGRFVERYGHNWDGTWMMGTFPAHKLSIDDYPEVKKYLSRFRDRLEPKPQGHSGRWNGRKSGSYDWFEIQDSISYHEEFRKPKIIYPNMTKYLPFYYDNQDFFFTNDKGFIITSDTEPLTYLVAVLNSHLFRCCFRDNFPELLGNSYEVRKVFVEKIPIKKPTEAEAALFDLLVPMAQLAKQEEMSVPASFIEEVIDACVLELYFPDEATAKELQFIGLVSSLLGSGESPTIGSIEAFYSTANGAKHPIRNQLLRLTADSPDLFAIIKREGAV